MTICNKDCFNCQYPDCVLDELDAEDYRESSQRDRALKERTDKQRKAAARQKAYYEANRDKVAARQKAYREANRDKVAAQQKAYREANRDKYNAYMRNYRKRSKCTPYHNRIKQRINAGELIGYEFREDYPRIGECLVLKFSAHPATRPIRPHKYVEYVDILAKWNKEAGQWKKSLCSRVSSR